MPSGGSRGPVSTLVSTMLNLLLLIAAVAGATSSTLLDARTTQRGVAPVPVPVGKIEIGAAAVGVLHPLAGLGLGDAGRTGTALGVHEFAKDYKSIGVRALRTHDNMGPLDMTTIYPDTTRDPNESESYNFTSADKAFKELVGAGVEVYWRVGYSMVQQPGNAWSHLNRNLSLDDSRGEPGNLWYGGYVNASTMANFGRAAAVTLARYTNRSLWGDDAAGSTIVAAEIWNEPDEGCDLYGCGSFKGHGGAPRWNMPPSTFYELYTTVARAIKAAVPGLKVGGPALGQSSISYISPGDPPSSPWMVGLLDHLNRTNQHDLLDFFSWHSYGPAHGKWGVQTYAELVRQTLDAHGFAHAESHITEWHAGAHTAAAAAQSTAAWIALQEVGVDQSYFYRAITPVSIDNPNRTCDNTPHYKTCEATNRTAMLTYGIFECVPPTCESLERLPLASAFQLWTSFSSVAVQRLQTTTTTGTSSLAVLAGRPAPAASACPWMLLVSNLGSDAIPYEIAVGDAASASTAVDVQQVLGTNATVHQYSADTSSLAIPGQAVQLVAPSGQCVSLQ